MGRSQSTISREIRRNTGQRGYRHKQANRLTNERHTNKVKAVKLTDEIQYVIGGLYPQSTIDGVNIRNPRIIIVTLPQMHLKTGLSCGLFVRNSYKTAHMAQSI